MPQPDRRLCLKHALTGGVGRALSAVDWRRSILALAIGSAGFGLLAWFGMPLAWMIGAMLFTSVCAVAGLSISVPKGLRSFMVMVLGIMLGSSFDPALLSQAEEWVVTLSCLAVYIAICAGVGFLFLRRTAGYDPVTAYFTAMPGGLNEMVIIGGTLGEIGR